jgi:hypothetical protein
MTKTLRELGGEGLLQNVMALWGVQFFRKALPLITIPYLARVLGPDGWGLVVIFQSLAASSCPSGWPRWLRVSSAHRQRWPPA